MARKLNTSNPPVIEWHFKLLLTFKIQTTGMEQAKLAFGDLIFNSNGI